MADPAALQDTKQAPCPVREVLSKATGKWQILIVLTLAEEPQRFNALKRSIGDVTQRVLTENLRGLERDGYLTREVDPGPPVAVTYSLTELGQELALTLRDLVGFAQRNMSRVAAARAVFDGAGAGAGHLRK
ncbi:winged helix-turn-helix transcriptional regulator [Antarctobacter jejuensis]|uniref:winged helix-turn-helix transcriptional regulator n=1 Tax=Antarctobacter jejuensis TaxID=1439938 RepID=UPI003FD58B83